MLTAVQVGAPCVSGADVFGSLLSGEGRLRPTVDPSPLGAASRGRVDTLRPAQGGFWGGRRVGRGTEQGLVCPLAPHWQKLDFVGPGRPLQSVTKLTPDCQRSPEGGLQSLGSRGGSGLGNSRRKPGAGSSGPPPSCFGEAGGWRLEAESRGSGAVSRPLTGSTPQGVLVRGVLSAVSSGACPALGHRSSGVSPPGEAPAWPFQCWARAPEVSR